MKRNLEIKELDFTHQNFWISFFCASYLNAADEETDYTLYDILDEADLVDKKVTDWWEEFTGYYEGVLEETDGYLENPATLEISVNKTETLKIEFHPGDILYYRNNKKIGSTGPHFALQAIDYKEIEQISTGEYGDALYFLLLPIAKLEKEEVSLAEDKIKKLLLSLFPANICEDMTRCIIGGLV